MAGEAILVVEDEEDLRELLVDFLSHAGRIPHAVQTVGEAVRVLETHPIALVLSDVGLPGGKSGIDLLSIVLERFPKVPVILLSGRGEFSGKVWHTPGALHCILKPYDFEDLMVLVDKALSR